VPLEAYTGQVRPTIPRWQSWAVAAQAKLEQLLEPAA
jgi:hypothetical protein